MSELNYPDSLQRFIFENAPVRGAIVKLNDSYQQVLARADYPPIICEVLGELMVAAELLAANLKFDGCVALQIQSSGSLKILLAEANSECTLRATAKLENNLAKTDSWLNLLGKDAEFIISIKPENGETYSGVVELKGDNLAQIIMNYMLQSEQLETWIYLEANQNMAAGLLLQRLPDVNSDTERWNHVCALANSIQPDELLKLDCESVLYRLYHQEYLRLFASEELAFACNCSQERVSDVLITLGKNEVNNILKEQGSVEIVCDFCKQRYLFDEQEVNDLFAAEQINQNYLGSTLQ